MNLSSTRNFYEIQPGATFKALIVDIKPGNVTIRLDNGGTFTARSMVLPDARIGEESLFIVRENNFKGQILLEMSKLNLEAKQDNVLKEAFSHAGIQSNDDNLALGKAMLDNGLPIDAHSLQRAVLFKYSLPHMPIERVVFLLSEKLPAEPGMLQTFQSILEKPMYLADVLAAHKLPYYSLDSPPLYKYFRHLMEYNIEEVNNILYLMGQIRHKKEYYQIPFKHKERVRQAELHILKSRPESAIVSIETNHLGRVEAFIQKDGQASLKIEFGCDSSVGLQIIKKSSHNIKRADLSFKMIDNAFTLLDFEPNSNLKTAKPPPARYTFDMRV